MTTTMTTNLKAETLMNLPVLGARTELAPARTRLATARPLHIGWVVPVVALLALLAAFQAFTTLAEINANLDHLAAFMQSPQF